MTNETTKMNPVIKMKWLEALESGRYAKGIGALRKTNHQETFCCLGVLSEIAVIDGIIEAPRLDEGKYYYEGSSAYLPHEVVRWAGLLYDNPFVPVRRGWRWLPNWLRDFAFDNYRASLAALNDTSSTFKPVIKAIKEGL